MKQMSLRKLKKMDGFFGRLFVYDEDAEQWLERMKLKMGYDYVYDKRKQNEDGSNLILAYLHKE